MEPTMVPASALDTVTPSASGERWKRSVSAWVVPEITTVSKPNSRPPSAATTVLRRRTEFNGIDGTFQQSCGLEFFAIHGYEEDLPARHSSGFACATGELFFS